MTWTKLGDEFPDAAAPLSDAAFRTHVEALAWSNRRLLDLRIPKREVRRFAETDDPDLAVKELVAGGWWDDHGDAWDLSPRFSDWQLERVQVEHKREQNAHRQRRSRLHRLGDHTLCLLTSPCRMSRRDQRGDERDDQRGDPGRVGTGTGQGGLDEERDECASCGRQSSMGLIAGQCRRCRFEDPGARRAR